MMEDVEGALARRARTIVKDLAGAGVRDGDQGAVVARVPEEPHVDAVVDAVIQLAKPPEDVCVGMGDKVAADEPAHSGPARERVSGSPPTRRCGEP